MTGIFLFIVVGLWVWACVAMTRALLRKVPSKGGRWLVAPLAFSALLALPVADEIIGGFQFRALCEKNAVFHIGVANPEGRVTKFSANPANEIMSGTAIRIYDTGAEYTDVQSGETVVKFHEYVAKGGVFIRTLGISEGNAPITIGRPGCSPEQTRGEAVHRTLKFSVIN